MNDEIRRSNDELPEGWAKTTLEDVAEVTMGQSPESKFYNDKGLGLPFFQGKAEFGAYSPTVRKWCSVPTKIALPNDILMSVRAPVGPTNRATEKCCIGRGLASIRAKQFVEQAYIHKYLKHLGPWLSEQGTGTTFKAISGDFIRVVPFPLAPLAEQKRIADKLESVLGRVDACRARLDRVPALLKRFRQSVLAAATSGKLTEEWREVRTGSEHGADVIKSDRIRKERLLRADPSLAKKKSSLESKINEEYLFELPETWAFTSWGTVSEWITYGFTRPMPQAKSGRRLVTAKDVRNFNLAISTSYFTTETAFNQLSDKDRPKRGDLLLTKDGTIGRTTLVRTDEPFCINQSVAVCWLRSTEMEKSYLEIVANAEFTQAFIRDKAQGMAIQHLSITDFAQCPLPVPPLPEQQEIVRRVEALFAFADRIEARLATAQKTVERLTPATLAKAFRGELVPQDPNDEPASVLLERFRATGNDSETPKKRKARLTKEHSGES